MAIKVIYLHISYVLHSPPKILNSLQFNAIAKGYRYLVNTTGRIERRKQIQNPANTE